MQKTKQLISPIVLSATASMAGVYIASKTSYWQIVLIAFSIMLIYFLIKNPKNIAVYIAVIFFIILFLLTKLDVTRHAKFQEFVRPDVQQYGDINIDIYGKVVDITHQNQTITIRCYTINGEKVTGNIDAFEFENVFDLKYGDYIFMEGTTTIDMVPRSNNIDYIRNKLSLHKYLIVSSKNYEVEKSSYSSANFFYNVRQSINECYDKLFPEKLSALAKAFTLGDKSGFDIETKENIKDSGLSHVFAISGLHLGIISIFLMWGLGRFVYKSKIKNALVILIIILFMFIVGYSPSVLRSGIMMLMYLSAFFFDRRGDSLTAVLFSIIIVLILFPFALFTASFTLSYGAIFSIILLFFPLSKIKAKIPKTIGSILTSLTCAIGTSIFAAYFFNTINFTSIWATIILTPLIFITIASLYLIYFINLISFGIAVFFSNCLVPVMQTLLWSIEKLTLTKTAIYPATPNFWVFIAFASILYCLHIILKKGVIPWLNDQLKPS